MSNDARVLVACRRQAGFSAVMAVIMVVLFAMLGTFIATMTGVQSISTTVSAGASQAWYAAQSGMEWAVYQVVNAGAHPEASLSCDNAANPVFSVSTSGGGSFQVTVECDFAPSPYTEGGTTVNVYRLRATASRGVPGELTYVSRSIRASVTAD
jgi:MSHA biogenesis protein MshP